MLKRVIIVFLTSSLLCGCTDSVKSYFQKSANNKLVDSKGFEGGKRPPLYNKKYISIAKKNVTEENFDDDEEDLLSEESTETINPTLRNRKMYLKMVKNDSNKTKNKNSKNNSTYPSLNLANDKVKNNNDDANIKLQKELEQIKALLNETKKDLAKYNSGSCTNQQNIDPQNSDVILPNKKRTSDIDVRQSKPSNSKIMSSNKTEMTNKFLSEDEDISDNIDRKNDFPINEQEKLDLPPRAI